MRKPIQFPVEGAAHADAQPAAPDGPEPGVGGLDMTKVMVEPLGCWTSVVIVLAWYTKTSVGHDTGLQAKMLQWLAALDSAVPRQFPQGSRDHGLPLMSDNGCQPTAVAFLKACATLDSTQAFTSDNTPTGNADTERLVRPLKDERLWPREWTSPLALEPALATWVEWYNTRHVQSALGDRTPCQVDQQLSHSTQFVAA